MGNPDYGNFIRYGNVGEDSYFLRLVYSRDGKMVCSNSAFNSDPAKGQPKACWRGPEFMGPSTTTTTRTGEKSEAIINGEICSDWVVVENNCVQGSPDYDEEGQVCAHDGEWNEAYCSYDVGASACARCLDNDE